MSDAVEYKDMGLANIIRSLKGKLPVAKVGILGGDNGRSGEGSNAKIGVKHEFGMEGMPVRSFLRVPIAENLQKYLNKNGAFDEEALKYIAKSGDWAPFVSKLGITGEEIVQDSFSSGGFEKWPQHAPGYTNNTGMILVDSQQLRNSISSEVEE